MKINNMKTLTNFINQAAIDYATKLGKKTFLYVYNNKCFEVFFAEECFRHLTGVESNLPSDDFYFLAKQNTLQEHHLYLGNNDYKTCLKKAKHLPDLFKLTITDTIVQEKTKTKYVAFELGVTNLKLTLLLHENTFLKNENGDIINNVFIPASFRVGGNSISLSNDFHTIDCVFAKNSNDEKYTAIAFQDDRFDISTLPANIKEKISNVLIEKEMDYIAAMNQVQETKEIDEDDLKYIISLAENLYNNIGKETSHMELQDYIENYVEMVTERGVNEVIAELKDELHQMEHSSRSSLNLVQEIERN